MSCFKSGRLPNTLRPVTIAISSVELIFRLSVERIIMMPAAPTTPPRNPSSSVIIPNE